MAVSLREVQQKRSVAPAAPVRHDDVLHIFSHELREVAWLLDAHEARTLYVTASYELVWGRTRESLEEDPHSWLDAVHAADRASVEKALEAGKSEGKEVECRILQPEGALRWIRLRVFPVRDQTGELTGIGFVADDLSERKFCDPHTGLHNRAMLRQHIELSLPRDDARLAVIAVSVERVGSLHDVFLDGHEDRVIVDVAKRLSACVPGVELVARLGSYTCGVVVRVQSPSEAHRLGACARAVIELPLEVEGTSVSLGANVGIALLDRLEGAEEMVRNAETALSRSRRKGLGHVEVFEASMRNEARERLELETDLRNALEAEAIDVHFQPIIELATGQLAGFEALARWCRPNGEHVSPAVFVAVAEEAGLIAHLDLCVLRKATRQFAAWRERMPHARRLTLHTNLSALHFADQDLANRVEAILEDAGLPPSTLQLELTESALVDNADRAARTMHALRQIGVRFGLDDFGTGYSSLSYLHRFPFDTLKVDREFVRAIDGRGERADLVRGILLLARSLRLAVVAEGVETREQLAFLQELDCEQAQGYLFAAPMHADKLNEMIERGHVTLV